MQTMPEKLRPLFFDTVTISNFALADQLKLLTRRYGRRVVITAEVRVEIEEGTAVGYAKLAAINPLVEQDFFSTTTLTHPERKIFQKLLGGLSSGEASCVVCAQARFGVVATDDRAARSCCTEHEIPFTGTIGILKACCRDNTLSPTEADEILATMVKNGFYAPIRRVTDIL